MFSFEKVAILNNGPTMLEILSFKPVQGEGTRNTGEATEGWIFG